MLNPFCVSAAMAAARSHLAMVSSSSSSSRVGVDMVAVGVSLEDTGAVEDRAVDTGVAGGNTSPLSKEERLTTNLPTTALLHLKTMGNKISTDREVSLRDSFGI